MPAGEIHFPPSSFFSFLSGPLHFDYALCCAVAVSTPVVELFKAKMDLIRIRFSVENLPKTVQLQLVALDHVERVDLRSVCYELSERIISLSLKNRESHWEIRRR